MKINQFCNRASKCHECKLADGISTWKLRYFATKSSLCIRQIASFYNLTSGDFSYGFIFNVYLFFRFRNGSNKEKNADVIDMDKSIKVKKEIHPFFVKVITDPWAKMAAEDFDVNHFEFLIIFDISKQCLFLDIIFILI